MGNKYKPVPFLENTKAPVELLGLAGLMNPLIDHTSSQRGVMFSNHLAQAQVVHGCEFPMLCSGFEALVGDYEYDSTERDQDIQVRHIIPRFITQIGMSPIKFNPYYTIIYRGDRDGKVSYFNREEYTFRSNRYGYKNQHLNQMLLNSGNFIPKETKLSTSPAHQGNKYCMGVNLNVAYMSLPQVTEDAFVISESAARKLSSTGIDQISFQILPNQIPLNLYGNELEYKFMPDVGEIVNEDCVVCALRTPTPDTILSDISQESLTRIQPLHDSKFYVPKGSEIIDIQVVVNRKCRVKTPREVFSQVQKYRDAINAYNLKVWEAYQETVREGREITPEFSTLVENAMKSLLADGVHVPGFTKRADITLCRKKEPIPWIHVQITYKYTHNVQKGFKLSGFCGN